MTSRRVRGAFVWERPELANRDRSLNTVPCLVTSGSSEQLFGHLRLAKANGLSEAELSEAITHLTFYAGRPKAMSAMAGSQALGGCPWRKAICARAAAMSSSLVLAWPLRPQRHCNCLAPRIFRGAARIRGSSDLFRVGWPFPRRQAPAGTRDAPRITRFSSGQSFRGLPA
ncbi:carboxymuconolactone decarboxylase family protein [Arthrobacter methylotrophus]|uniref:Carboxymuconolactone decarboxylase family protein n=1 Tax=Arthrobacter methylotrophus TaxID=121291 RepID=A0ABV5UVP5_9MICC